MGSRRPLLRRSSGSRLISRWGGLADWLIRAMWRIDRLADPRRGGLTDLREVRIGRTGRYATFRTGLYVQGRGAECGVYFRALSGT
jgi:hypothetical protein